MMERYSEYKDSGVKWLGEIPSHWEVVRGLGVFSENKSKNTQFENSTVLSLSYGKIIVKKDIDSGLVPEEYSSYQIVRPGCIIVRSTDLQNDKTSLRIGYVCNEGIITSAYLGLQVKGNNNDKYLYYFLHDWDITKEIYRHGNGLRQSLSWNDLRDISVLLPPLSEQDAIVRYLDSATSEIDKAIAMQQKMIDLLNERKQIIIQNAVTKGLDENVEMKESGIFCFGKIPKHWLIKGWNHIFYNLDKLRKPISAEQRSRRNPQYDYYGASGVIDKIDYYNVDDKILLIGEDGANLKMRNLPLVYKANGKIWVNNHAHILKPIEDNYDYMAYLMETFDYNPYITGSAQPKLSQEQLGMVRLCVPPIEEQKKIVIYLEKRLKGFDSAITNCQRQITLLQERKQIIINEVVTGKVRVS